MVKKEFIKRYRVNFTFNDASAGEVRLVGDFNDWNTGIPVMKRDGNGSWRKTVMLPPGDYEYRFLVDGRWECDPRNAESRVNCYGTLNNLIRL